MRTVTLHKNRTPLDLLIFGSCYPTAAIAVVAPPFSPPNLENGVTARGSYIYPTAPGTIFGIIFKPDGSFQTVPNSRYGKISAQWTRCWKPRAEIPNTLVFMTSRKWPFWTLERVSPGCWCCCCSYQIFGRIFFILPLELGLWNLVHTFF